MVDCLSLPTHWSLFLQNLTQIVDCLPLPTHRLLFLQNLTQIVDYPSLPTHRSLFLQNLTQIVDQRSNAESQLVYYQHASPKNRFQSYQSIWCPFQPKCRFLHEFFEIQKFHAIVFSLREVRNLLLNGVE